MEKFRTIFITISAFFLILIHDTSFAKSYSINAIVINAEIQKDGSLLIQEHRTYNFKGRFRWADYSLPLTQLGRVTDFTLIENGASYQRDNSKTPGTYQLAQDENSLHVKWFYSALNENRTFTLSYRVENAVQVYDDVAVFYYKFVGEKSSKSAAMVDVSLKLPRPATTDSVRAWSHGPFHGELRFYEDLIRLWVQPLPRKQFWEVRTVFPNYWIENTALKQSGFILDEIMQEEAAWAKAANETRQEQEARTIAREQNAKQTRDWSITLGLAGLLLWFLIYRRHGTGYVIPARAKFSSTLPDEFSPALTNYVYYQGQLSSGAMVATIFDLARRGYLKLFETKKTVSYLFFKKDKSIYAIRLNKEHLAESGDRLTDYESDLISFLFNELSNDGVEIDFDTIKNKQTTVMRWFRKWKKLIGTHWDSHFIEKSSVKAMFISLAVAVVVIGFGVLFVINYSGMGAIAIGIGIVIFILSFFILKYTQDYKTIRSKIASFYRYMKKMHFRTQDSAQFHNRFEDYFIYGISLGLGQKVIEEIMTTYNTGRANYFLWYHPYSSAGTPTDFATAVSSMVTAASTTMSSSTGTNGGASSGGGGGAGGASGGAG